ncbi:MAG: thioredoxin domain-containing protein [Planctomycetota bacterium]|nr:thioredoxin domain-containing protein [Planctomycetota bacterium]
MPNRLANETSPYLLQHANNPVDWHPWGPEALARSQAEQKPIFLSIGYSACHWCHVMEHESFENTLIAAALNDKFINIKVDREERPDLDQIYMNAVQLITGRGGWPMSVFLTPDLQPFFGGTYWPPDARMGMPGFDQVIAAVDDAWRNRREQAIEQAGELTRHLQQIGHTDTAAGQLAPELLGHAVAKLEQVFDFTNGGFGQAPKFPHSMDLQLLMRVWFRARRDGVLDMVKLNLDKMARGGIYDHLAGGFARYTVDARWLVPHFEKMLYDNALLTGAYLDGYLITRDEAYARVVRESLDYILGYMTDERGGFHSTEDADSEGEEGKFYVWTPAEIKEILGDERADRFCYVYDVTEAGNFEGHNILNLPKTIAQCASLRGWDLNELQDELAESRAALLAVRDRRVRPGKDDKILVSWNSLMIDSMARAAGILGDAKYLDAARAAAEFILNEMRRDDGRLLHSWRTGEAKFDAYLDDYSYLINAFVSLYEASFDERWIDEAVTLADLILAHFPDTSAGGFFFTADDHEQLIARNKDMHDSSVPSGNAMSATALLRLGKLTGRNDYLEAARGALESAIGIMRQSPTAAGQMLIAADMFFGPVNEVAIVCAGDEDVSRIAHDLCRRYIPNRVVAARTPDAVNRSTHLDPLFEGKPAGDGSVNVFVCENFACQAPVSGTEQIEALWNELANS